MVNPYEELMNGGMSGIQAFLTNKTCGEACWYAKEDVCRCSCNGLNHGCLLKAGAQQPGRTAIIDGARYRLAAVGKTDVYGGAEAINKSQPKRKLGNYEYVWRETEAGAPARVRKATESQIERWAELAAAKEEIAAIKSRRHAPIEYLRIWPHLLWVRIDIKEE